MAEDHDPVTPASESVPAATVPARVPIPDHELIRLIGRGSYGEVWLARNAVGTFRAVKIVYEKTFRHKRPFDREFNGVQKFEPISRSHEGLMDILHIGRNETAGYFYCVMELADDVASGPAIDPKSYSPRTLAQDISRHQRLPVEECRRVGVAIAQALDFLHARGLIHRDIKPSNIVFVNGVPKLADIGLVAEMSEARSYVGTEGFIPPEGPGTVQSDLYSLGKVLYEISTGKDRHDYPDLPTLLEADERSVKELFEFNKIVLKACRSDPVQRYQSAGAMVVDLTAMICRDDEPLSRIRRKAGVAVLAAGLAVAGGLLLLANRRLHPTADSAPLAAKPSVSVPAPAGLVAWWKGEGDGADSAGKHRLVELGGVEFVSGKVGQAFSFDGSAHRVIASNSPTVNFGAGQDFSIEAWIQPRGTDTNLGIMSIVGKEHYLNETQCVGYELGLMEGKVLLHLCDSLSKVYSQFSAGPDLRDGRFHHVAVIVRRESRDGSKLYVDGKSVLQFDPTGQSGDLSNAEPLRLGCSSFPGFDKFFNGLIDEVGIYNRALQASEIEAIYRAGAAGKSGGHTNRFSFDPQIEFSVACQPGMVVTSDFDRDGNPDFAVTAVHKICVYHNVGTHHPLTISSFDLPVDLLIETAFENAFWLSATDVDGDGKVDLLATDRRTNRLIIFRNISSAGTVAFAEPVFYAAGAEPRAAGVGDLDGDGRPDVVIADFDSNSIRILRNVSTPGTIDPGSFVQISDLAVESHPAGVAIEDLDGDGRPDVAISNYDGSSISIFRNTGEPAAMNLFAPRFELPTPSNCVCVAVGDVDGDGKVDLVCGTRYSLMMSVYRNISGPGGLSPNSFAARVDFPVASWVNSLSLGDLDGDGRPEIFLVGQRSSRFAIYPNLSTPGSFTTNSLDDPVELRVGTNPACAVMADFNQNGWMDIIVANGYSCTLSIFQKRRPAGIP